MKVAIVTGALGGIGMASAIALIEKGYKVVGMGRSRKGEIPEKYKNDFTLVLGDISSPLDREHLIQTAKSIGTITALVNVAGVAPKERRDILEMTEESYDYVMGINTKATFFLTQAVAADMLLSKTQGYIVNISSCSAYTSSTSRGEYCISKAGVSMITKLFADRLANSGIVVNEICPGIIRTGMTATVEEKYNKLIAEGLVPQGRWGEPEDVAKVVALLADGSFSYTTGCSFIVDGGMHIRSL